MKPGTLCLSIIEPRHKKTVVRLEMDGSDSSFLREGRTRRQVGPKWPSWDAFEGASGVYEVRRRENLSLPSLPPSLLRLLTAPPLAPPPCRSIAPPARALPPTSPTRAPLAPCFATVPDYVRFSHLGGVLVSRPRVLGFLKFRRQCRCMGTPPPSCS
jgi:hypothetical protein